MVFASVLLMDYHIPRVRRGCQLKSEGRANFFLRPTRRQTRRALGRGTRPHPPALSDTPPQARGLCTGRRGLGKCQESGQFGASCWEKGGSPKNGGRGATPRPCPRRCYLLSTLTQNKNQKSKFTFSPCPGPWRGCSYLLGLGAQKGVLAARIDDLLLAASR